MTLFDVGHLIYFWSITQEWLSLNGKICLVKMPISFSFEKSSNKVFILMNFNICSYDTLQLWYFFQ